MPHVSLDSQILYGVALDDLLLDDGRIRFQSGDELRAAFRLTSDARLCLIASVKDNLLESFWSQSQVQQVWRQIYAFGFEFVTGLSFSVFEMHSRSGQLLNQDRNRLSAAFLAAEGLTVVPLICGFLEEDLAFEVRWLEAHPEIRVVGGLEQGFRTDQEFARFLGRMRYLRSRVQRHLHFLIIGCSSASRISMLSKELESVTVTANVGLRGSLGEWWDPDQGEFVAVPAEIWGREKMIRSSIAGFVDFCDEVLRAA